MSNNNQSFVSWKTNPFFALAAGFFFFYDLRRFNLNELYLMFFMQCKDYSNAITGLTLLINSDFDWCSVTDFPA